MLHFENDYNQSIHPALLEALSASQNQHFSGYGTDDYTQLATEKIRQACQAPQAEVVFLTGGTQTNQIAIACLLKRHEGVIATDTGHISTHEAGAIEYTGHKVLTLPHNQGKLRPEQVADYLANFHAGGNKAHMVTPGMVYISHPTEYGTLYTKAELTALAKICQTYQIPLFLDGARLAYGLAAKGTDLDLPAIAELCDLFYIGGTKVGAFAGEALVFTKGNKPPQLTSMIKQHGALLAKGWLISLQFDRLFTDDLYLTIGKEAIALAQQLKQLLLDKGYQLYIDSPTNQQFPIVPNDKLTQLAQGLAYSYWETYDDQHTVIRLATSWSTTASDIAALAELLA